MTNTSNYNLLLPEGTDLVNYLTDTNPNFTALDSIIKGVSDKTITTATEVTVGTAHAITRSLPDCPVMRFTATSNWTTGDTITVDGSPVTALKTDGTTLKSGDYIIGSEVIAVLQSTRLTVFVSSAAPVNASDIVYDNTSSGLAATDVQEAIDEVNSDLTVKKYTTSAGTVNPVVEGATNNAFRYSPSIDISSDVAAYGTPISVFAYGYGGLAFPAEYHSNNISALGTAYAEQADVTFVVLFSKHINAINF